MTARRSSRARSQAAAAPAAARDDGVRLVWPGRTWRMDHEDPGLVEPRRVACGSPASRGGLRVCTRPFDVTPPSASSVGAPPARIVRGDVLDLVDTLIAEGASRSVELVYVDPPYASDRDYVAEARLDGSADGRVVRTPAYADTWGTQRGGLGAYLDMLAPRLDALVSLLAPSGTIWVHVDWRASYLVRAILDEILGREQFLNEIVWRRAPNLGRQATSGQFGRTLDTIVVYGRPGAKIVPPTRLEPIEPAAIRQDEQGRYFTSAPRGDYTDASIAKLDAEGRVHRTASGRVYIKYFLVQDAAGVWCRERRVDALWTDVAPLRHAAASERTGYPTQKPLALLERIIRAASREGDLVVDAFGGSGTTAVAAHALGRRVVVSDRSPVAIATARARLLRAGAAVRVEHVPAGPACSPPVPGAVPHEARIEGDDLFVALAATEEPMAWAIGTFEGDVFEAAWHAERVLGSKAAPAQRQASLRAGATYFVRTWGDDGTVTTSPLDLGARS